MGQTRRIAPLLVLATLLGPGSLASASTAASVHRLDRTSPAPPAALDAFAAFLESPSYGGLNDVFAPASPAYVYAEGLAISTGLLPADSSITATVDEATGDVVAEESGTRIEFSQIEVDEQGSIVDLARRGVLLSESVYAIGLTFAGDDPTSLRVEVHSVRYFDDLTEIVIVTTNDTGDPVTMDAITLGSSDVAFALGSLTLDPGTNYGRIDAPGGAAGTFSAVIDDGSAVPIDVRVALPEQGSPQPPARPLPDQPPRPDDTKPPTDTTGATTGSSDTKPPTDTAGATTGSTESDDDPFAPTVEDFQKEAEEFLLTDDVAEQTGVSLVQAKCDLPSSTTDGTTFACRAVTDDTTTWEFNIEITGGDELTVQDGAPVD